jgi:hypothetical protein
LGGEYTFVATADRRFPTNSGQLVRNQLGGCRGFSVRGVKLAPSPQINAVHHQAPAALFESAWRGIAATRRKGEHMGVHEWRGRVAMALIYAGGSLCAREQRYRYFLFSAPELTAITGGNGYSLRARSNSWHYHGEVEVVRARVRRRRGDVRRASRRRAGGGAEDRGRGRTLAAARGGGARPHSAGEAAAQQPRRGRLPCTHGRRGTIPTERGACVTTTLLPRHATAVVAHGLGFSKPWVLAVALTRGRCGHRDGGRFTPRPASATSSTPRSLSGFS